MNARDELEKLDREWQRYGSYPRLQRRGRLWSLCMMAGFGVVVIGLRFDHPLKLAVWPRVCMALGSGLVVTGLAFCINNGRRLQNYHQAALNYDNRRAELLRKIDAGEDDGSP